MHMDAKYAVVRHAGTFPAGVAAVDAPDTTSRASTTEDALPATSATAITTETMEQTSVSILFAGKRRG